VTILHLMCEDEVLPCLAAIMLRIHSATSQETLRSTTAITYECSREVERPYCDGLRSRIVQDNPALARFH
jgi:hypothetical protein